MGKEKKSLPNLKTWTSFCLLVDFAPVHQSCVYWPDESPGGQILQEKYRVTSWSLVPCKQQVFNLIVYKCLAQVFCLYHLHAWCWRGPEGASNPLNLELQF